MKTWQTKILFFRLSKVNDSWKKQVFGETHYWNLEWIKEEITLSNGYIVIHRISVIKTYCAVQVKEPIYPVDSVIHPSSDRGQKAHLRERRVLFLTSSQTSQKTTTHEKPSRETRHSRLPRVCVASFLLKTKK